MTHLSSVPQAQVLPLAGEFDEGIAALILHTSGTNWKREEQKVPFVASYDQNGIIMLDSSRYVTVRSAQEEANSASKNLEEKVDNVLRAIAALRKAGAEQESFLKQLEKEGIKFKGGNKTALHRIYALADDTIQIVPMDIIDRILPILRSEYIVEDGIKIEHQDADGNPFVYDGVACGRITSIGPIMSAVKQERFWELLRHTAAELEPYRSGKPVIVYHEVNCSLVCLSDPETTPAIKRTTTTAMQLYAPNGLLGEVKSSSAIPTTDDFLCLPEDPTRPISSYYSHYALNQSARKKMHDEICALIKKNEPAIQKNTQTSSLQAAAIEIARREEKKKQREIEDALRAAGRKTVQKAKAAKIFLLSAGSDTLDRIGNLNVKKRVCLDKMGIEPIAPKDLPEDNKPILMDECLNALSMRFSKNPNKPYITDTTHPDVVVFAPFDSDDEVLRAYNFLMLDAAIVAKATDPCCQNMQIMVMNQKDENGIGCYDAFLEKHIEYAKSGYNKEYIKPACHMGLKDGETVINSAAKHTPFFYIDLLEHENMRELVAGAYDVARFHLKNYHRLKSQTFEETIGGDPIPETTCTATGYASASSDRLSDHKNGAFIGKFLARCSVGVRSGAGDQHSMWTFIQSYLLEITRKLRKPYASGITTHPIAKVETKSGRVSSEFTHHKIFNLLGPRQAELLKSFIYFSLGGGNGTGLETGLVHLLKLLDHPIVRDKDLINIGKDAAMHAELKSQIGEKAYEELRQNPYALADKGVYLFPEAQQTTPLFKALIGRFSSRPAAGHRSEQRRTTQQYG